MICEDGFQSLIKKEGQCSKVPHFIGTIEAISQMIMKTPKHELSRHVLN